MKARGTIKPRRRSRVVVFMASPALVRTLDRISDERLCTRSEVLRDLAEKAAEKWRKRKAK
jgi:metal-responsive CopG/Arc/MetJ family transcriptional regulator